MPGSAPAILLLDVNGTLTDPAAIGDPWVRPELGTNALDRAVGTAMVDALLDRGDRPFSDHLAAAVRVLVAEHDLDPAGTERALENAAALPARPEAAAALQRLAGAGVRLVALTNSGAEAGAATLRSAGLSEHVEAVIGVDAVRSFKPHPRVYAHALDRLGAQPRDVMLLATHPWDLAGAANAGIATAWVTHGARGWPEVFPAPDLSAPGLAGIAEQVLDAGRAG